MAQHTAPTSDTHATHAVTQIRSFALSRATGGGAESARVSKSHLRATHIRTFRLFATRRLRLSCIISSCRSRLLARAARPQRRVPRSPASCGRLLSVPHSGFLPSAPPRRIRAARSPAVGRSLVSRAACPAAPLQQKRRPQASPSCCLHLALALPPAPRRGLRRAPAARDRQKLYHALCDRAAGGPGGHRQQRCRRFPPDCL